MKQSLYNRFASDFYLRQAQSTLVVVGHDFINEAIFKWALIQLSFSIGMNFQLADQNYQPRFAQVRSWASVQLR